MTRAPVAPLLPPRTVSCSDGSHSARIGNERVFIMEWKPGAEGGEVGSTTILSMSHKAFAEIVASWNAKP